MQFRTVAEVPKFPFTVSHQDTVLMIGSCFTESIGARLANSKFDVLVNPTGICYDPFAIANTLYRIVENAPYMENDLFYENGLWHSWDHHSRYSGEDKEQVLEFMNIHFSSFRAALKDAKVLFITFGTAWYHTLKDNDRKVANCHKVVASRFERKIAKVNELIQAWEDVIQSLRYYNPSLQIVTTVSPVRHIKNGLIGDKQSKSVLRTLCGELNQHYFPSYEIMMDDLRDYRFYERDMIHPTLQARDYIWNYFVESFLTKSTKEILVMVKKINAALSHKPFHIDSVEHQKFVKKSLDQLETIQSQLPYLNFSKEIKAFESQLVS